WVAGEAMKDKGFYSKPMFPSGPNMLQTAAIAASLTGQPWAAILVATATSGIQMADGTMTWKQAAFQVGVTAATSAIGVGAAKLGDMAGAAAGSALAGSAVKATTVSFGNTLVSGVQLEGGGLGWDGDRMTKMSTWTSAGVNAVTSTITQNYCSSGISKALVGGIGSGISQGLTTGDWKESMVTGVRGSAAGYLSGQLGGVLGDTTGLGGSAVDNFLNYSMRKMLGSKEEFSWDMIAQNNAVGEMMSNYMSEFLSGPPVDMAAKRKDEMKKLGFTDEEADTILENEMGLAAKQQRDYDKLGFLDKLETSVGGMYLSMKNDMLNLGRDMGKLTETIKTGVTAAAKGVSDAMSAVVAAAGALGTSVERMFTGAVSAEGRVLGYEPDRDGDTVDMPELRKNTNAEKLIRNLASNHEIPAEAMTEMMLVANGVETVEELQEMIRNGDQLKALDGFGWETGMQGEYYADYDRMLAMQKAMRDINAGLRQAELGTHGEANALYEQQNSVFSLGDRSYGVGGISGGALLTCGIGSLGGDLQLSFFDEERDVM
ncbi:MAG TPA: hypothetical protein PLT13_16725, partial [Spirochaetota bacterium]|nr:hypothetical protein [Spirochaetota bacterium]